MSTKHTPGPWIDTSERIEDSERGVIAIIPASAPAEPTWRRTPREQANARLITAAPDMLEALKVIGRLPLPPRARKALDAAIAKAETVA